MNNVNNLVARMDAERKVAVAKAKLETSQQLAAMAAVAFFLGFATGREGALFLLGGQAFLFGIYVWKAKDDLRLAKWQNARADLPPASDAARDSGTESAHGG